jgi:SAM-dependent methyltransferase
MEIGLPKYTRNIVREFRSYAEPEIYKDGFKVLDFGAGTGALAQIWLDEYLVQPDCVEIDPDLIKILKDKNFKVFSDLNRLQLKYNYIYSSNVLEHIEDDKEVLSEIFNKLEDEGKLAIYVPAFPILFSSLDYKVGHFRRYRKKEIRKKLESAGFEIQEIRYCDSLGFIGTLILKSLKIDTGMALSSPGFLRFHDTIFHPSSLILDKFGFNRAFGKNILVFANKPA